MTPSIPFSPSTLDLLAALGAFSSGRLTRPDDRGLLYESAERGGEQAEFDELSFQAKFVHKTYGILQRLGKDGQGYDRMEGEFRAALERCGTLARRVLSGAPPAVQEQFAARYLALTPAALQDFLALCYDLSWYKNWHIDRRQAQSPPSEGGTR